MLLMGDCEFVGEGSHTASGPSSPLSTQLFTASADSGSPAHAASSNNFFTTDITNDVRQSRLSLIAASANEMVTEDADDILPPTAVCDSNVRLNRVF